ncbi:hypothetical protein [Arcanobacterium pinnipediorum]|uniref:ATPase n=1 Tax=Arcanobacterium pinnipediorum TaxID=1503041 RepID=A0ABY5AH77_9ACTO|nr:hypothetical protein [Arcanobacterium pinnipediorum]USR78841.1 hypothetical protein NG665_05460 [Arcanobacterium pinnipediorum]
MSDQGESLLEILDELYDIVVNAKNMPLSASVLVNRSEIIDLLDTARDIVPDQIKQADAVLSQAGRVSDQARDDAEVVLRQAHEEADSILAEAREQASRLVAQDQITVAAKSQATRIVDEAHQKASQLINGANQYSEQTLAELATQLMHLQEQIAAGQGVLAQRRSQEQ